MKIKLLCSRSGVDFSQSAGDEIEVSEKEGLAMIAAGQADAVSKVERTSAKQPTQKAVKK